MEKPLVKKKCLLEKYPGKGGWTYAAIPEVLPDKKTRFGWVKVKGTILTYFLILFFISMAHAQKQRSREQGIKIGVLPTGGLNAITDVSGVKVGHATLIAGDSVRTGVTAILPHEGNVFQEKVPAAVYVGNGFGKLAGSTQIDELGNLECPIILTGTLSVGTAMDAVIEYTLKQEGNETVRSVNAVVGETNDGYLNDIRGRHIKPEDVLSAIEQASTGPVAEGGVGAGTGTVCFGFKGGIGTSSRQLPDLLGGYTVGINSLFMANTTSGFQDRTVEALPLDKVLPILKERGVIE